MERKPNRLASSASPYLQQHAFNPVDWYPWGSEALAKARSEDKLILVSVGYSACHWCHVMEHECFENDEVAQIMNDFFVCVKVDREERPDIDQVYMAAVQLLTGRGGWPLNCFTLPDGRPVYGGTYFPRKSWMELLTNLASMYRNDRSRLEDYARQLAEGVASADALPELQLNEDAIAYPINDAVETWKQLLDYHEGGPNRAPKFPLPNNYQFLLRYAHVQGDQSIADQVRLTLKKMAYGGIYDQIGGGFTRYSVDGIWKVPHFEKMLYDNAQLIALYSEGYKCWKDPLYRDIVYQTTAFMEREWWSPHGCFYAALDADSEGEEGKYYVWNMVELENLLGADFPLAACYFNINERGLWEHGNHIPLRHDDDSVIAGQFNVSDEELRRRVGRIRNLMLQHRELRVRPGLDDKLLTSWNALAVSGYVSAYTAFADDSFLDRAKQVFGFISTHMRVADGGLYHSWKPDSTPVEGFLEDYAFAIAAAVDLYRATFDYRYLDSAIGWMHYTVRHFYDASSGLFFFTSGLSEPLFVRKIEYQDNVIPASCSQMARNLYQLSYYTGNREWEAMSDRMLAVITPMVKGYGSAFSNWLDLMLQRSVLLQEVVICGTGAIAELKKLHEKEYQPYLMVDGCEADSRTPATQNRLVDDKLVVYYCNNHVCGLPFPDMDGLAF
ncbi:MAG: thioredoxin domain-containing protein [Bacteroidota bacterium]